MVEPAAKPKPVAHTTLVLRLSQIRVDNENPAKFNYTVPHDFTMTANTLEYVDYEGNKVSISESFEKTSAVFGKIKPGVARPHVFFDGNLQSVKEQQFDIHVQLDLKKNPHFFLSNLCPTMPTTLRVGKKTPYLLAKGMILDLQGTLLEVKEVGPEPTESDVNSPNSFYADVVAKLLVDQGDAVTLDKKNKAKKSPSKGKKINPPELKLSIFNGKDAGKEFAFEPEPKGKTDLLVRVGSDPEAEVKIEGLLPVHLNLKFDSTDKIWKAYTEVEEAQAFVLLIDAEQCRKAELPKDKRVLVLLREDMKIAFGGNEIEVHLK